MPACYCPYVQCTGCAIAVQKYGPAPMVTAENTRREPDYPQASQQMKDAKQKTPKQVQPTQKASGEQVSDKSSEIHINNITNYYYQIGQTKLAQKREAEQRLLKEQQAANRALEQQPSFSAQSKPIETPPHHNAPMVADKPVYPPCPGCLLYSQPFYCQGTDQSGMYPCPGIGGLSALGNPNMMGAPPALNPYGYSMNMWGNMKPFPSNSDLMN